MTIASLARRGALAGTLALAVGVLPGCSDWAGYDLDMASGKIAALSTMRRNVIPDPYEMVRRPAEGTIPVVNPMGDIPPPFTQAALDSVAATLRDPLTPTPVVLARGQVLFNRNCVPCHGPQGAGNGPVTGPQKFPFAPAINSAATAARSDGYIYAVIDVGRGLMPPYGDHMTNLDRWTVVNYVRHLQRAAGAVPSVAPARPPVPPSVVPGEGATGRTVPPESAQAAATPPAPRTP